MNSQSLEDAQAGFCYWQNNSVVTFYVADTRAYASKNLLPSYWHASTPFNEIYSNSNDRKALNMYGLRYYKRGSNWYQYFQKRDSFVWSLTMMCHFHKSWNLLSFSRARVVWELEAELVGGLDHTVGSCRWSRLWAYTLTPTSRHQI